MPAWCALADRTTINGPRPRSARWSKTGATLLMRLRPACDNFSAAVVRDAHETSLMTAGQPPLTRTRSNFQSVQASLVCSMKKLPPGTSFTSTIRIGELSTEYTKSPPSCVIETV